MKFRNFRILCLFLAFAMGTLSACGPASKRAGSAGEPDDGSVKVYYDDRIAVSQFGTGALELRDQKVTSKKVGSDTPDDAVLYYDEANAQLIAVGTGTAVVCVGSKEQLVRVRPAPISLFMITGHSIGAGEEGDPNQSIACEPGTAYSTYGASGFSIALPDMGLGYSASQKPPGADAFAAGGAGTLGEGSGVAWRWHQLTGEKLWVLNAAVGGSVIPEWVPGQTYYRRAVAMYQAAAQVLTQETKAGHYTVKNTAVIYHSGANFVYKKVEYTDSKLEAWYDSMVDGFLKELAVDFDADGKLQTPDAIGFLPMWSSRSTAALFKEDRPVNFYMAASNAYPSCMMVAETMRNWGTDAHVQQNFPAIDYATQKTPVTQPATARSLLAADGVHYTQVGYNAAGIEIGENLYRYLRTEAKLESLKVYDEMGLEIADTHTLKGVGDSEKLVLFAQPCYVSNFEIKVSDNLELTSPFCITAKAAGEGKITISYNGKTVKTITVAIGG